MKICLSGHPVYEHIYKKYYNSMLHLIIQVTSYKVNIFFSSEVCKNNIKLEICLSGHPVYEHVYKKYYNYILHLIIHQTSHYSKLIHIGYL